METRKGLPWYRTDLARGLFVAAVLFHLFFASQFAFTIQMKNDEGCYLATLYRLMLQSTEGFCDGRTNYFAPGAPLLWLPAGWLALGLSSVSQLWLFHWLQPLVALYSFGLFGVSIFVLFLTVRAFLDDLPEARARRPWLLAIAIVLNSPIIYYAGKWAVMPHTAQLLTAVATVYFLDRRRFFLAALAGLLLSATRFNDLPVILMIAGKIWDERESWKTDVFRLLHRKAAAVLIGITFVSAIGFIGWTAFVHGYGPTTLSSIFLNVSLNKLRFFLFHDRWGVFWMTPWWVLAIFLGLLRFPRLSNFARGAIGWLLVEAYVATSWGGNGGDFGYRYLIGSFAAAWVVWRELVRLHGRKFYLFFLGLTFAGAVWMTYLNVVYRAIPELSPSLVQVEGGPKGALVFGGLSHFQIEALKHLFDSSVYISWIKRDWPLVQLWWNWFKLPEDLQARGTDQLALAFAAFGSFFYVLVFARRNLSHFLACRKASRTAGTEIPSAPSAPPESLSGP